MSKSIGQSRLLQEMKAMVKEKMENLFAQPLENDMFTWHFTILGPENTDFHEGIYHGQIVLPFQYPFKPPDIYFFTKNGRFEVQTKICLTITQYHPEEWNSAWTIRTMLEAVISLFNEHVPGVGYVQSNSQTRQMLAKNSHSFACEKCGPIKNILKIRKPMAVQQPEPIVLPKPIPFATHQARKFSQAPIFKEEDNSEPIIEPPKQPIGQQRPISFQGKSIFDAVKKNLLLLQWAQITSKFTKKPQ